MSDGLTSSFLTSVPLFADLTVSECAALQQFAIKRHYAKHTVILSEGDLTDSVYLLVAGKVKVIMTEPDGREVILSVLESGEFFGEMALIDAQPRSATIMSMESCDCFVISRTGFNTCLSQHPSIARQVMLNLVRRLRAADEKIGSLALLDVYGRCAKFFLDHAVLDKGVWVVSPKVSQQELANRVGASREMVSKVLKDLVRVGALRNEAGSMIINKSYFHNTK